MAEFEGSGHGPPLQTPGETPYTTPATSMSRRSSRPSTARDSRAPSSSPPPMPDDERRRSHISMNDESISILDPRRFTPTLHANLVSEILSLRRELDSKHKFIEDLEASLHTSKAENDSLTQKLSHSHKEGRSAKRQIQQLEHGTLSALEELARDRDEKKQTCDDLKAKVERLEKKVKAQEEDAARTQMLWERDHEKFESQKRNLERAAHVSETRLKGLLAELAQQQAVQDHQNTQESEDEETRDSGLGNDSDTNSVRSNGPKRTPSRKARHARNMSNISQRSLHRAYRYSAQSDNAGKTNGLSLADELALDDEDDDGLEEIDEDEEEDFLEQSPRTRRGHVPRSSVDSDLKAKRILGLSDDATLPPVNETASARSIHAQAYNNESRHEPTPIKNHEAANTLNTSSSQTVGLPKPFFDYVDAAVQWSRPGTPEQGEPHTFFDDTISAPSSANHSRIQSMASVVADSFTQSRVQSMASAFESRIQSMASFGPEWASNNRSQSAASTHDSGTETPLPQDADAVIIRQALRPQVVMVSTSVQTAEDPPSPPETPKVSETDPNPIAHAQQSLPRPVPDEHRKIFEMNTVSTQTDPMEQLVLGGKSSKSLDRHNKPDPLLVPSITIVPPTSAPTSPKDTILPPGTKNMSTQTVIDELFSVRSISIQTEEIRVDQRLMKLAPHLLPSAIRSLPNSSANSIRVRDSQQSIRSMDSVDSTMGPNATPKQLSEKALGKSPLMKSQDLSSSVMTMLPSDSEADTEARYPLSNDIGLLKQGPSQGHQVGKDKSIRRPLRPGNLFGGLEEDTKGKKHGDKVGESYGKMQLPVSSYATSTSQTRNLRDLRDQRTYPKPPTPVPEEKEVTSRASSESVRQRAQNGRHARNSTENARISKKQPSIRRSTLIKGSGNAHGQRSRSPSLQSGGSSTQSASLSGGVAPPPFPIPNRMSSRKIMPTGSKSDGASSPTPRGAGLSYFARRNQKGQHIARNESIRKVKSAAVIPRQSTERSRSRSPPAPSRDSGPPPMPQDAVTGKQYAYAPQQMNSSVQTPVTPKPDNVSESGQPTVVDAIAATMVGEWMWKYVRRRKSFGVTESPDDIRNARDAGSGVRHKRWVWISPYERSVMWSSKQPASGSALLGKSGRKLLIQSVLDVKDDTPAPRGSNIQPSFNRSILILTPARALKFTAISQERHYLWLTALSFLAHSGVGAPELAAVPPIPQLDHEITPATSTFGRRAPIRDSVRIAKDKHRPSALSSFTSSRDSKKDIASISPTIHAETPISDAADAPSIPRYTYNIHGRKRSNTGPRIPPVPSAFRSFTSPAVPPHVNYSVSSGPSHANTYDMDSDRRANNHISFSGGLSQPASLYGTNSTSASARISEATSRALPSPQFEDFGTMRMEAFVAPRRPSVDTGNMVSSAIGNGAPGKMRAGMPTAGRARGNTQWSSSTSADPRRTGALHFAGVDDYDPFRNF